MIFRNTLFLVLSWMLLAGGACAQSDAARPHNVIFFISDGCGPASFTLARDYLRAEGSAETLNLDGMLVGSIRTYSADHNITDSAAGATALASGVKTKNRTVGIDTLGRPVATVLEGAERLGMATGLIATRTISNATPAGFSAHEASRYNEDGIAVQQAEQGIEVLFGGGQRHFLPSAAGGDREDGRNLFDEMRARGYQVISSREAFDQPLRAPVVGLFSDAEMAYEIDRDERREPSLAEMTRTAIDLLKDDADGFLLMVEGSRIDQAAHDNDAAAHVHDVLAFDKAVGVALAFARTHGNTLVISTSDHETGGLSLNRDNVPGTYNYFWYPQVLAPIERSFEAMIAEIVGGQAPCVVLERDAAVTCTGAEQDALLAAGMDKKKLELTLGQMIAQRAEIAWGTTGHTAVDVNLYAYGPGRERFIGHHDNTAVGRLIAELMGFDLAGLTETLRRTVGSN